MGVKRKVDEGRKRKEKRRKEKNGGEEFAALGVQGSWLKVGKGRKKVERKG